MAVLVKKFGGSSLATSEQVAGIARRLIRDKREGHKVVAVVSAPGDTTDDLIGRAHEVASNPDARELDVLLATGEQQACALLAMAIKARRKRALSFFGEASGIHTDDRHTNAKIESVRVTALRRALKEGQIVIVAGFQGVDRHRELTTLGRGGSDLTAVALAAALKADRCELYKDVDGIYTANPRVVKEARLLRELTYEEMLEMSSVGAQVVNARAVAYARQYDVPLHIRSSFHDRPGTSIVKEVPMEEKPLISGVVASTHEAEVTILGVPDRPGVAALLFKAIARNGINVDVIVQDVSEDGMTNISFTVPSADLKRTLKVIKRLEPRLPIKGGVQSDENIAKISVIGVGMKHHPGVAAKMFDALSGRKINIQMISTSEIKITCIIEKKYADAAVRAIHRKFFGRAKTA